MDPESGNGYLISDLLPNGLPFPCAITLPGSDTIYTLQFAPITNSDSSFFFPSAVIVASSTGGSNREAWGPVTYSGDQTAPNGDGSESILIPLSSLQPARGIFPGWYFGPRHLEHR